MFQRIAYGVAAALTASTFFAQNGSAMTSSGPSTPTYKYVPKLDYEHNTLVSEITNHGVKFIVNPSACWEPENKRSFGWFWMYGREMVICQEKKQYPNVISAFTREDLDTIRHEAQHMIQECMDGRWNTELDPVYKDPLGLGQEVLGGDGVARVHEVYDDLPYSHRVLEVEAFAVAAMNVPYEQAGDIQYYCEGVY